MKWRCRSADKAWYKQKFEWRIEFNFSEEKRKWPDNRWLDFLNVCQMNSWVFHRRHEIFCNIYTSELSLLDFILENKEYLDGINYIEFTSDNYLSELTTAVCGEAVTDIKFVSHLQTEFRYQVFLGGFEWKETATKEAITTYLATNYNEFLFKGHHQEIINRVKQNKNEPIPNQWGHYQYVYDGFNFFSKSTDDILMLHMIAPGKIRKIVKIMERTK